MCQRCPNPVFKQTLEDLIYNAKQHSFASLERNKILTQIIRMISPLLRRSNYPDEEDARQKALMMFVTYVDRFDPSQHCLVAWLNSCFYYRRLDFIVQRRTQQQNEIPLDSILSPEEKFCQKVMPDLPSRDYGSCTMLDRVLEWVETDPDGILRQTHLKYHPEINAQVMIVLRLPSTDLPWKAIAAQFNKPLPALAAFYQRKCLPLLREFGKREGLL
jgi:hypothetical protein